MEAKDGEEKDGAEEEEEDDDLKDGAPTFGKDGRPQGRLPTFDPNSTQELGTAVELLGGTGIYQTGKPGSPAGVLLLTDFYGWHGGRVRSVADYLAKCLSASVVVPRLLDKPCHGEGTDGDGLEPEFDWSQESNDKEFRVWMMRYVWQTFLTKLEAAVLQLRSLGAKRIALVGFCFGSWAAFKVAESITEVVCNVVFYPSMHIVEEINDGDPAKLHRGIRTPVMFVTTRDAPALYSEDGRMYQELLQRNPNDCEYMQQREVKHNFLLRGDCQEPNVLEAIETSLLEAGNFMRKFLWPPPAGANAATLRLMCQEGDHELVHQLLSAGVPAAGRDARDVIGLMPMHYAAKSDGSVQAIQMLVEFEADVNVTGGIAHEAPLHIAAANSSLKPLKALLLARADVNLQDKGGQTALHICCREGDLKCVQVLLKAKADIHIRDTPSEQVPLHLAVWHGQEPIVKLLLQVRADLESEDIRSQTPLKRAYQQGYQALVDILEVEQKKRADQALLEQELASAQALAAKKAESLLNSRAGTAATKEGGKSPSPSRLGTAATVHPA